MKLGIEAMVQTMLFLIGFVFVFSIYVISLEAADAKQYHIWVMEKLEGARYADSVLEHCVQQAEEKGYELLIQEEKSKGRQYKNIILRYQIPIPFFTHEKTYQISGYSYEKGGEEI